MKKYALKERSLMIQVLAIFAALMGLVLLAPKSFGGISVSKTLEFSPEKIERLEKAIINAENRSGNARKYIFFQTVDATEDITLSCLPDYPRRGSKGEGCVLTFGIEISKGVRLAIKHNVMMRTTSAEVQAAIAQRNPNATDEHLQFPGFTDFGTHYHCEPKGDAGARKWTCILFAFDDVN